MDNALRMNHNFHALHIDAEKPVRLDHLKCLVEKRGGIDCDFGPHIPGRMKKGLLWCDLGKLRCRGFAKWATGRRQNYPPNLFVGQASNLWLLTHRQGASATVKALKNGVV